MKQQGMKRAAGVAVVVVASLVLSERAYADGAFGCVAQPVIQLEAYVEGEAYLCQSPRGLRAKMYVEHLVSGDAYTVWWMYFDDPTACAVPFECGLADFAGPDPLGVFGRMDSKVKPKPETVRKPQ